MKIRILSGLLMVPFLVFFWLGGRCLIGLCCLIALIGVTEFYNAFKQLGVRGNRLIGWAGVLALYLIGWFRPDNLRFVLFWLFLFTVCSFLYIFRLERRQPIDGLVTLAGLIYVGFFSYHLVLLDRLVPAGMVWLVLTGAFGTDIFAYFIGTAIGRHQLVPSISPKKTVEGAIGGVLGSVLLSGIAGWLLFPHHWHHGLLIGLLSGIVSQLGDLSASVLKRHLGIKDFGQLIPGHGGILDRFDSIFFTAPVVYYYALLVFGTAC
ncbi:MAG TPA: phosphatidate cytidylyltransferase [Clostridiales bacterium]|nr:phosphatidate cytidylyltransferase [Clostridiales bacterium]